MRFLYTLILLVLLFSCGGLEDNAIQNLDNGDESSNPGGNDTDTSLFLRTPYNSDEFEKQALFSCEFHNGFDPEFWENPRDDKFATWTFKPENSYTADGKLNLKIKYDPHKRGDKDLYFTSGMLRSKQKVGYGYYEARIKGADIWPGTCSAFWLYTFPSEIDNSNGHKNDVVYNEIDIIELQQVPKSKGVLSQNMHIWILDKDLKNEQIKAGQYPKLGKNETTVSWNPEDDYHVYAVENRPDSVVFYVDDKRVASKPNYFWHMDMYLTLSLGLRTPFEKYDDSQNRIAINPSTLDKSTLDKDGEFVNPDKPHEFTSVMYVDYVRSWKRDYTKFENLNREFTDEDKQTFK